MAVCVCVCLCVFVCVCVCVCVCVSVQVEARAGLRAACVARTLDDVDTALREATAASLPDDCPEVVDTQRVRHRLIEERDTEDALLHSDAVKSLEELDKLFARAAELDITVRCCGEPMRVVYDCAVCD